MTQVKMGVGNVVFSNLGPMRVNTSSLRLNPYFACFFYFQYYYFLVIQPHIIEIIMLSG